MITRRSFIAGLAGMALSSPAWGGEEEGFASKLPSHFSPPEASGVDLSLRYDAILNTGIDNSGSMYDLPSFRILHLLRAFAAALQDAELQYLLTRGANGRFLFMMFIWAEYRRPVFATPVVVDRRDNCAGLKSIVNFLNTAANSIERCANNINRGGAGYAKSVHSWSSTDTPAAMYYGLSNLVPWLPYVEKAVNNLITDDNNSRSDTASFEEAKAFARKENITSNGLILGNPDATINNIDAYNKQIAEGPGAFVENAERNLERSIKRKLINDMS